jgi:hypothetical protein
MLEKEECETKYIDLSGSNYDGQIGLIAAVEVYGEKGKVAVIMGG